MPIIEWAIFVDYLFECTCVSSNKLANSFYLGLKRGKWHTHTLTHNVTYLNDKGQQLSERRNWGREGTKMATNFRSNLENSIKPIGFQYGTNFANSRKIKIADAAAVSVSLLALQSFPLHVLFDTHTHRYS